MPALERLLQHLEHDYTQPVRDPLWKNIALTPALAACLNTPPLVRLSRLKQLGLAYQVYPGATHTRLNHSLGVFHLAKRIITTLLKHPDCPALSLEGVKAFLCASLFHDLGHFPYAHVLEDGLDVLNHEQMSGHHILNSELTERLQLDVGTDPALVAAIVNHKLSAPGWEAELPLYRRLLSGVLDPDKLDYLNRDAYFCGIPYGNQDVDFIISQMQPHRDLGLVLTSKGAMSIEAILFSKYLMYKAVYWHKGVRTPSAVIKKALFQGLSAGIIRPDDLYGLDDHNFSAVLAKKDYPPLSQIQRAEQPGEFRTLYEEPYDDQGLFAVRFSETRERYKLEDEIRLEVSRQAGRPVAAEELTIDLPHSVSFEVNLGVIKGSKVLPFMDSGTVFDKATVHNFPRALKRLRLIGPAWLEGRLKDPARLLHG